MSGKGASKRSIKSAQINMREIHMSFGGDAGGDAIGGPDEFLVESVTDGGAGLYTIILKGKAASDEQDIVLKGFSSSTADCNVQVIAATGTQIQVQCHVAGVAADADISLTLGLHDQRFKYEA